MTQFPFLSPDWIVAARSIRDEFEGQSTTPIEELRANIVVTNPPFSDEDIAGHVDSTAGALIVDEGHVDDPELTVTTDYDTAFALFVDRDPAKVMESFMLGKILVTGDVAKVMGFAAVERPTDPGEIELANEIASRLAAITAS